MLRIRSVVRLARIPRGQLRTFGHFRPVLNIHQLADQTDQFQDVKKQIDTLLEKVPDNKDEDAPVIFEELITKIPGSNTSLISAKILGLINASTKNLELLKLALQNVKSEDLNEEDLDNMILIVNKLSKVSSIPPEIQNLFSQIFIERCNDEIIRKFISGIEEYEGSFNKHILVTLYLKTKRYDEAYGLVHQTLKSGGSLQSPSIELLVHHLCHFNYVERATKIMELAKERKHTIYPRTYSLFLSMLIDLNEYKILTKVYPDILQKMYVSNGTLARLSECLVHAGDYYGVKSLKRLAKKRQSFPDDLMARMNRSVVEAGGAYMEFENSFRKLAKAKTHRGEDLEVSDYPYLLGSLKLRGYKRTNEMVENKMKRDESNLKTFVVDMVVKKYCDVGDINAALMLLHKTRGVRQNIAESTILQLTHGALICDDKDALREILDFVEHRDIKFKKEKTVNLLLAALVDSEHWFYSFKILQRCEIEGYKMRPATYAKLAAKCEKYETDQHLKYNPQN